jgi:hypothetical protein
MPLTQRQDLHCSLKLQSDPGIAWPPQFCGLGLGVARAVRATSSLDWWLADCVVGGRVLGLTIKQKLTSKGGNEGKDSSHFDKNFIVLGELGRIGV